MKLIDYGSQYSEHADKMIPLNVMSTLQSQRQHDFAASVAQTSRLILHELENEMTYMLTIAGPDTAFCLIRWLCHMWTMIDVVRIPTCCPSLRRHKPWA